MALALVALAPGAVSAEVADSDAIGTHTDALQAVLADYGVKLQAADAVVSPMNWPEVHATGGTIAEAEVSPATSCQCPAPHDTSHEHYAPQALAPSRADFTYRASRELRTQIHRPAVTGRTALGQADVGVPLGPPRMGLTDGVHPAKTGRTALASRER